jgi:hypothetical protein
MNSSMQVDFHMSNLDGGNVTYTYNNKLLASFRGPLLKCLTQFYFSAVSFTVHSSNWYVFAGQQERKVDAHLSLPTKENFKRKPYRPERSKCNSLRVRYVIGTATKNLTVNEEKGFYPLYTAAESLFRYFKGTVSPAMVERTCDGRF